MGLSDRNPDFESNKNGKILLVSVSKVKICKGIWKFSECFYSLEGG